MDGAHHKLDELKAEIEELKKDCHAKKELSESLRKATNEQLLQLKEAKTLIDEKVRQVDAKTEELSELRQMNENLKSSLDEKESSLRHLSFVNEKLRVEYNDKVTSLEEEKKGLILALDEATLKNQESDKTICAGNEEIERLKRLLSIAQKKCLETDENARASKECQCREGILLEIEEENMNVKDQLKWKREQFQHLKEAHEQLQDQFQQGKVEWEREKSDLLKDLYSLKSSLDSQTRISEDLQRQLKICNQALSHEESKRKVLEIEVVELRSKFDNVVFEFEEAKSKIEELTHDRDDNIAELRNELGIKETLSKEMKYRVSHLEKENDELQELLKECREEQIKLAGGISLKRLQSKLRRLEQLHSQCSLNFTKKEDEWNSRYEKMTEVLNGNICDLKKKDMEIQELQNRLEGCHYMLEFQNESEEILVCGKSELDLRSNTIHRLENQKSNLSAKMADSGNGDCDESLKCHVRLKEQFAQMETTFRRSSEDILTALEAVNSELLRKTNEVDQTKLKLHQWKSKAEEAKSGFEENRKIFQQEKDNLVVLVKGQDEKIGMLGQQVALFDSKIAGKMMDIKALEQEKDYYFQVAENKGSDIKELENEIAWLKREFAKKQEEKKMFEQKEKSYLKVIKEKDQGIEDLCRRVISREQDIESEIVSSFSEITEKQIIIDVITGAMYKAEKEKELQIQEKDEINDLLKKERNILCDEISSLKEALFRSKKQTTQLNEELEIQKSEAEDLKNQLSNKEFQVIELQRESENLLGEVMKLSSQRENMIANMEATYDCVVDLSSKDAELESTLEKILLTVNNRVEKALVSTCGELCISISEGVETPLSPSTKRVTEKIDKRSPLKALNH